MPLKAADPKSKKNPYQPFTGVLITCAVPKKVTLYSIIKQKRRNNKEYGLNVIGFAKTIKIL